MIHSGEDPWQHDVAPSRAHANYKFIATSDKRGIGPIEELGGYLKLEPAFYRYDLIWFVGDEHVLRRMILMEPLPHFSELIKSCDLGWKLLDFKHRCRIKHFTDIL